MVELPCVLSDADELDAADEEDMDELETTE